MDSSEQNQKSDSQTHDGQHQQSGIDQDTAISSRARTRVNLHPVPPPGPRGRVGRIFMAVAIILLVAVIIVTVTPLRNLIISPSSSPSPTQTASPPKTIAISFDPHVGSVTFKGKTYHQSFAVQPAAGIYSFTWRGAPFQPITCTATVPFSLPQDTCGPYEYVSPETPNSESITFFPNLSYLSTREQAALLQQIQAALATLKASETVLPGEHYALFSPGTQFTSIAQATSPLQATLSFHLDTDPHSTRQCGQNDGECGLNGLDCRVFCTSIEDYVQSTATEFRWHVVAVLYSEWDYKTLDGKTVATGQPDSTSDVTGTEHSVHLDLTWNRAADTWHVSLPIQSLSSSGGLVSPSFIGIDIGCANAQELTTASYGVTKQTPATTVTWKFAIGSNHAAGCLAVAQSDSNPHAASAYFLYRFGVLLAANALAHSYFPDFPQADASEQSIALQIAAQSKS